MPVTDPIADLLTHIRNGVAVRKESVTMPCSKVKISVAEVLMREGFISGFEILPRRIQNELRVDLKYGPEGEKVIQKIDRFSSPGCRKYRGVEDLPRILNGLGIAVVSTNKGVLSDRECREQKVGGEVLCTVY